MNTNERRNMIEELISSYTEEIKDPDITEIEYKAKVNNYRQWLYNQGAADLLDEYKAFTSNEEHLQ